MPSTSAAVAYRTLSPCRTLLGSTGDSLQNKDPGPLPDGAVCMVAELGAFYRLAKRSTADVDGERIIATMTGVGRWIQVTGNSSLSPMHTLFWCDEHFEGTSTGSIVAPFRTLQEAIDAIGEDGGSILMAPGEYGPGVFPPNLLVNIYGLAGAQGGIDGNVEIGALSIGAGAGVRLESIALDGDITLTGSGTLFCYDVSFYTHNIIQSGAGGWDVQIAGDGIEDCDPGFITASLLVAQNVTLQRDVTITNGIAKLLYTTAQGDIIFSGTPGSLLTDLFTLNILRNQGGSIVNGSASIIDAPIYARVVETPTFASAGIDTVSVVIVDVRPGDTFNVVNTSALPTGVALGVPRCEVSGTVIIPLLAFGAAVAGTVDLNIQVFNGGG